MTVHKETVFDPNFETVLVPTDGSDATVAAADHAIDLCVQTDAALHVVNVVDTAAIMVGVDVSPVFDALAEAGEQATASIAERAAVAGVSSVETAVLRGSPFREIVNYADEWDADCVVMGTHGRTGLRRYVLGSVTERVLRFSEVPVVSIHADTSN